MAANAEDGSYKVYREIYQETSSGDFGIQVKDGPLFRCHTHILAKSGGFIQKVRHFGKVLPREVEPNSVPLVKDYFKAKGYTRLLKDLAGIQFSQTVEHSALQSMTSKLMRNEDPLRPGYTTAHFIGGTTGALRRADPYMLAERYELDCDCERMAELLRFIYQGLMSFLDAHPRDEKEQEVLTHKMLSITMDAERYSVDALYEKLLDWFGSESYWVLGERNFADAFYHMEHFVLQCTEEHSKNSLIAVVTGDMLRSREQFRAVTRDPRWTSLPVEFVEGTLKYDGMPIGTEAEVLSLIELWNAHTDKKKEDIVRLLCCFRPDEETRPILMAWLTSMGWLGTDGRVADVSSLRGLSRVVDGTASRGKKPRRNLQGTALLEAQQQLATEKEDAKGRPDEAEATFIHYRGSTVVGRGNTFALGSAQRLVQADPIKAAGTQRLRMVLSNPRRHLWDPEHEVFVGCSYGEGRYFGFLCSATAFSGIFSVRALASAAPAPNAPIHLTGSGNKVEFDLSLEVQLQRVNLVVVCKLGVVFANQTLTEEYFQIAYDTLVHGAGLSYQVVATGLGDDLIDVQLAWVETQAAADEKEAAAGPLDFQPGD